MWNRLVPAEGDGPGPPAARRPRCTCRSCTPASTICSACCCTSAARSLLLVDPDPAAPDRCWPGTAPASWRPTPTPSCCGRSWPTRPAHRCPTYGRTAAPSTRSTRAPCSGCSARPAAATPRLIQLYGQSETGPVAFGWYTRRGADRVRTAGGWAPAIPGFTRMRVVDERGRKCPPGCPGGHRGPHPGPDPHLPRRPGEYDAPGGRRLVADGRHGLPRPLGRAVSDRP